MSRFDENCAAVAGGVLGLMLLIGSIKSVWMGGVTLRRYSAPLDQAWPTVVLLSLLGILLVVLSIVHIARVSRN